MIGGNNLLFTDPAFDDAQSPRWKIILDFNIEKSFFSTVASTGSATEIKITVFLSFVYICFRLLYKNR